MSISIEKRVEPINPCTLIALQMLVSFFEKTIVNGNPEKADEIITAEKELREMEDSYLRDLLWGRLTFKLTETNPKLPMLPPIFDILQICEDAKVVGLRCEIFVTDQERHEYEECESMGFLREIKHRLPNGPTEYVQERSKNLWLQLKNGPIFTNIGEAGHLCESVVLARQELIKRNRHYNDSEIRGAEKFIPYNPVRLLFLSEGQKVSDAFKATLDDYFIAFSRSRGKRISWRANILPWHRQTATLFSILGRKQELFGSDEIYFSQKDFSSLDPFVLDGYKPIEVLLILARQKRINVDGVDKMPDGKTIQLKIRMKQTVIPHKKSVVPNEDSGDELQRAQNQILTLNAKKKILAQIVLDLMPLKNEEGAVVFDPVDLVASIPGFSKRGLHDLCVLIEKEGYFKVTFHWPESRLERQLWDSIGPRNIDNFDNINRITIFPNERKLEELAFLSPANDDAAGTKDKSKGISKEKDLGPLAYVLTRNISGHLHINDHILIKPTSGSVGDRFIEYILKSEHPRPLIISEVELTKIRRSDKKSAPKIITDLGFIGDIRDAFFPATSKSQVTFVNPIYESDLIERGLKRLKDYD